MERLCLNRRESALIDRNHRSLIIIYLSVFVAFFLLVYFIEQNTKSHVYTPDRITPSKTHPADSSIFDGCYHVYIDVGSSHGIQVRKLYEPTRYPGSSHLPIFEQYFGNALSRGGVCTLGIEPDPQLGQKLKEIENAYQTCGYPVIFLPKTATSDYHGRAVLYKDVADGVDLIEKKLTNHTKDEVIGHIKVLDLTSIILRHVATRKLPSYELLTPPSVIVRVDIEGSEVETLTSLVLNGAMPYINMTMVIWHGFVNDEVRRNNMAKLKPAMDALSQVSKLFNVTDTIDDSYSDSELSFIECSPSIRHWPHSYTYEEILTYSDFL